MTDMPRGFRPFSPHPVRPGAHAEAVDGAVDEIVADWGPCHSCSCRGFMSTPKKNNICGTCGHHWSRHW